MNFLPFVNIKQGSLSDHRFSNGNTLPLVQLPFGFSSFALQTNSTRSSWFYSPLDRSFEGIRLTHMPSPWIAEHGGLIMQPQSEIPHTDPGVRYSGFDPKKAVLMPHYMSVYANRSHSFTELVPTMYGAKIRITFKTDFPKYLSAFPVDDQSEFRFDPETDRLYATTHTNNRFGSNNRHLSEYFVLQFKKGDIDVSGIIAESLAEKTRENALTLEGEKIGIHLLLTTDNLEYTVASSYISHEQALRNLKADAGLTFEEQKLADADIWNEHLGRIAIEADEDTMRTFYSCLYRTFLFPHRAYEPDENGNPVHFVPTLNAVKPGVRYTDNGFWDTYRTNYSLYSLIAGEELKEILAGFIVDYTDTGWLPCWTAYDAKKCMPSTGIDAVISDAAMKGILSGELLEEAFRGMEKHANQDCPMVGCGREGCSEYLKYGYVPYDHFGETVNLSLDAAYFDDCVANVAALLGYTEKETKYRLRAKNYSKLFDKETGFMRARDEKGAFRPDFDPLKWGGDYTEASAWQTSLAVQHDPDGLAELYGGKEAFLAHLDKLFATPPDFRVNTYRSEIHEMTEMSAADWGQCAISNQPSFHIPYFYAYFGQTQKCEYWIKRITAEGFSAADDGFPGDEDNGSMSAWYIFACLGIYPFCPGKPYFTHITPLVKNIKLCGKEFDLSNSGNLVSFDEIK